MADPNPLRKHKPIGDHGRLYERKAAKKLDARLQPNSGAMESAKGDMKVKGKDRTWLMECKSTSSTRIAVELGWLVKISEEAHRQGSTPALTIAFVTPDGRPRPNAETEWVAMPMQVFNELNKGA